MLATLRKWRKSASDKAELRILMVCMGNTRSSYERAGFVRFMYGMEAN